MDSFNRIMFDKTMTILKWDKQTPIFEGALDPLYASLDYCDVYYIEGKGFAVLNHAPKYSLYQRLNIPEIQDIFILPAYRQQGLATRLIQHCEMQSKADMIGISVPVSPQFGAAQKLYIKLGYVPDGNGVTYDREGVIHNAMVRVDDDLCLMLVKDLK